DALTQSRQRLAQADVEQMSAMRQHHALAYGMSILRLLSRASGADHQRRVISFCIARLMPATFRREDRLGCDGRRFRAVTFSSGRHHGVEGISAHRKT